MDDLFSDLRDDDFEDAESPGVAAPLDSFSETAPSSFDDDFDQLRDKSARTDSTYDEMDTSLDDEFDDGRTGFSLSVFTTPQKLILLALLLLDIVAVGFGVLVLLDFI
ncbi:MAG: hypothetical protein GY803_26235 [Chloroflexi bacterium]|nr:hypothetical protein [Chloroflexota bacterium]